MLFLLPFLSIPTLVLGDYAPTPTSPPKPTRPFTVAAFLSPFPSGTNGSVSGVTMRAQAGSFWLDPLNSKPNTGCGGGYGKGGCPLGNETVLWVDRFGQSWLVCPSSLGVGNVIEEVGEMRVLNG